MKNFSPLKNKLSTPLIATSIILWAYSVFVASNPIYGTFLSLINSLSITYFISLGLLTLAFIIDLTNDKSYSIILFFEIFLLIAFLRLPQAIFDQTPILYSYDKYGFVDYVLRTNHLNSTLIWGHNWPGFPVFFASLIKIAGITNPIPLMTLAPFLFDLLYLLPLYFFFNSLNLSRGKLWLALWLFFLVDWTGQDYFSPQALSLFFFILIVALLTYLFQQSNSRKLLSRTITVLASILYFMLVITHFLTSAALLAIVFAFAFYFYFKKKTGPFFNIFLIFLVIFCAWFSYQAIIYFQPRISSFTPQFLNLNSFFSQSFSHQISGASQSLRLASELKILLSGIVVLFGASGYVLARRLKKKINYPLVVGVFFLALLIPLYPYGGEMLIRVYILSLLPALYLVVQNLDSKKLAACLLILLFALPALNLVAYYGNDIFEYTPKQSINGALFFFNYTSAPAYITGGTSGLNSFINPESYTYINFVGQFPLVWENGILVPNKQSLNTLWPNYVWFSAVDVRYYQYYDPQDFNFVSGLQNQLNNATNYVRAYDNGEFVIYSQDNVT